MPRPLIALLTDFGLTDPYVGIMKGVMRGICPDADFVDISHGVRPQAVGQAAFLLATSHLHFPDGTIFLCVVDPGVGSDRAALALKTDRHLYVAPDNGLLSLVWRQAKARAAHMIVEQRYRLPEVSHTFHGRDIFAPAAAHLAAGVPIEALGPSVPDIEELSFASARREEPTCLRGEIVHIDHFGNLITNIRQSDLPRGVEASALQIQVADRAVQGLVTTYSAAGVGEPLAHIGSSGMLEIAVRRGHAAKHFGVDVGDAVRLRWPR